MKHVSSVGIFWLLLVLGSLPASKAASPMASPANIAWKAGEAIPSRLPDLTQGMTLVLQVPDLKTSGDLLLWKGPKDRHAVRIWIAADSVPQALIAEIGVDQRAAGLQVRAPLALLGREEPHVILVRYLGYRLELFVDGVLRDEEWPLGTLLAPADSGQIIGDSVTHLSLWNRALKDEELSGDPASLKNRERQSLGLASTPGQYWRPRGWNAYAGDCMPFFHEGRFHLYYLFDRRHHSSKWGLGAHQWAHLSSTSLVQWEEHPMAVPITDKAEGSICTGSVFFHEGTFYAFYAVRTTDGSPAPLHAATSVDGLHFTKHPSLGRLSDRYTGGSARDPVVFREEGSGLFHMLVTTTLQRSEIAGRGGCLAHLVSRDLKDWEEREPFLVPGYPGEPECADYFAWRGWYYLIFSNQGVARYRMSREPLGPWLRPAVDAFDGPQASVMKTAPFTGDRRLGAAFLSAGGYAGDVVFREIIQHPDGTLGTKWPAEMRLPTSSSRDAGSVKLSAQDTLRVVPIGKGKDFVLRARVKPAANASYFGVRFGAGERMKGGCELRFEPLREKVGLRAADASSVDECEGSSLYDVTGLDQPFEFELLVKGDLVDVCVNRNRTLVARWATSESGLFAFAQNAEVEFEQVQIAPLAVEEKSNH